MKDVFLMSQGWHSTGEVALAMFMFVYECARVPNMKGLFDKSYRGKTKKSVSTRVKAAMNNGWTEKFFSRYEWDYVENMWACRLEVVTTPRSIRLTTTDMRLMQMEKSQTNNDGPEVSMLGIIEKSWTATFSFSAVYFSLRHLCLRRSLCRN